MEDGFVKYLHAAFSISLAVVLEQTHGSTLVHRSNPNPGKLKRCRSNKKICAKICHITARLELIPSNLETKLKHAKIHFHF